MDTDTVMLPRWRLRTLLPVAKEGLEEYADGKITDKNVYKALGYFMGLAKDFITLAEAARPTTVDRFYQTETDAEYEAPEAGTEKPK